MAELPAAIDPNAEWEHLELWRAVKRALLSLPSRFQSDLVVSGVLATDLFAFNSSLGATIEEQVVASLNRLRSVWDADQKYALYSFERQSQTFPDVVLRCADPAQEPRVLMGIELKGWYVLAKEREPSFRYKVTPAVCAPADLLVVVPWALSRVISGSPQVFDPFVMGARHAAECRNWYWGHDRASKNDKGIHLSSATTWYPKKSDAIADHPKYDESNFGRLARSGVMKDYASALFEDKLSGIPLSAWQKFLGIFTDESSPTSLETKLTKLLRALSTSTNLGDSGAMQKELSDIIAALESRG